jgi:hypothetical protein
MGHFQSQTVKLPEGSYPHMAVIQVNYDDSARSIIIPIKWGALWSYEEFPNHWIFIYLLVTCQGVNELILIP